jgi:AcrR family transcriptional regulator
MKRWEKKENLIQSAIDLFQCGGYHASGIDKIIATAGVAKTTLYRHFKTKEDLIVAALRTIDERYRNDMRKFVNEKEKAPEKRLLATFDYLEKWFDSGKFFGCPFLSAASEYNDRTDMVFLEARQHKRLVLAYFEELARAAGLQNPEAVAAQVNLLHEGAVAVMHINQDKSAAARAKAVAGLLVGGTPANSF